MKNKLRIRRLWTTYYRRTLGWVGETIALWHYWRRWHYIWQRNWRCTCGEVDLITIRNRTLHLIEVKTRILRRGKFRALDQLTDSKRIKLHLLLDRVRINNKLEFRRRRIMKYQIDFFGIDISFPTRIPQLTITHIPQILSIDIPSSPQRYDEVNYQLVYRALAKKENAEDS